ncbi:hypothetical protein D3C71_1354740 [compost metagenome]
MHPAWHQIVARAFRRALGQNWRLDIEEAFTIEEIAEDFGRLGTKQQRLMHFRTAQVKITIFQTERLVHFHTVFDEERRRLGRVQHVDFRNADFDFAGRQVRVNGLRVALDDFALHGDYIFAAHLVGCLQRFARVCRVEDNLHDAAAVAKIDEQQAPKVTPGLHPSVQSNRLSNMFGGQLTAVVSSLHKIIIPFP